MNIKKTLFIVGAKGYIGSALFLSAKKKGIVIGTSSSGGNGFLSLSLDKPNNFDYSKIRPGDVFFFTSAISSPDICAKNYQYAYMINVKNTLLIIKNIIDHGACVIFFSSDTVYGECKKSFNENVTYNPVGEYAKMKIKVEQTFVNNPLFKTIRLSYVFSRKDKFSKYLIECNDQNKKAELFHPIYRSIVYLKDVVDGALTLATRWNEFPEHIINFAGPETISRVSFAKCLKKIYLNKLDFKVLDPGLEFFKNRPKYISMSSSIIVLVL